MDLSPLLLTKGLSFAPQHVARLKLKMLEYWAMGSVFTDSIVVGERETRR